MAISTRIPEHRIFPVTAGICLVFLLLYVLIGEQIGWGAGASREPLPGEVSRWCERVSAGVFREPVNSLSNLGFMVVGLGMLWVLSKDRHASNRNAFHGLTPVATLYALAAIWLGPGSLLMHGTHTTWGAWADNLSMVMYILIPWLFNVSEMGRWPGTRMMKVYVGIVLVYAVSWWLIGKRFGIHLDLFRLSIALWTISELLYRFWSPLVRWLSGLAGFVIAAAFGTMPREMLEQPEKYWWVILFWLPAILSRHPPRGRRRYFPWFFAGWAVYMAAFGIWLTGRPDHPWCDPDSLLQAHAVWHLLGAIATGCFFLFLRTEEPA